MRTRRQALGVATMMALLLAGSTTGAQQYTFVTGPLGGSWYPIGSGMVEIMQNKAGITFTQKPGGGVSNAFSVGADKAQLGITTAGAAASAFKGAGEFEGKAQKNVRLLGAMYPQEYTLVVWADSAIKSVGDLKGKVLQTTRRGSSTELMTRHVLDAHGLSYDDLKSVNHSNLSDGVNQMKDNQADAMSHLITNPTTHILELSANRKVRLIALDAAAIKKLSSTYPGYTTTMIKAGTYKDIDRDVPTIGGGAVLITRAELDEDTVYKMTKALFENQAALMNIRKVMKNFNPKQASANPIIPIHPGALRYFREVGVAQ